MNRAKKEQIDKMLKAAAQVVENWTRDGENAVWTMCGDYNDEHYGEDEIFMCEVSDEEDPQKVIGFAIEDEVFIYKEEH